MRDIAGMRFGRLTAVHPTDRRSGHAIMWACTCDCGGTVVVSGSNLRFGVTQSCGCLCRERTVEACRIHGDSMGGGQTSEYRAWASMKARCHNSRNAAFARYGGRGIMVCARWRKSYSAFLADMGRKPAKEYSIERLDNDRGYTPENCRWVTRQEQQRNKRNTRWATFAGRTQSIAGWSQELGLNEGCVRIRLGRLGWSVRKAFMEPVR